MEAGRSDANAEGGNPPGTPPPADLNTTPIQGNQQNRGQQQNQRNKPKRLRLAERQREALRQDASAYMTEMKELVGRPDSSAGDILALVQTLERLLTSWRRRI